MTLVLYRTRPARPQNLLATPIRGASDTALAFLDDFGFADDPASKGLANNFGRILSSGRGVFEVIHEHPLKFYGYLLSCAKIPPAKKSDPDCNAEIRMLNNSQSGA